MCTYDVYEVTPKEFLSNGTTSDDALIKWYAAPSLQAVQTYFPNAAKIVHIGSQKQFPDIDGCIIG